MPISSRVTDKILSLGTEIQGGNFSADELDSYLLEVGQYLVNTMPYDFDLSLIINISNIFHSLRRKSPSEYGVKNIDEQQAISIAIENIYYKLAEVSMQLRNPPKDDPYKTIPEKLTKVGEQIQYIGKILGKLSSVIGSFYAYHYLWGN
ncbi:MAG: hypothetical protein H6558_18625 [Lewinellaceae bacterium]|nr:hypothetical protein [Lewinellaceae bacterium]